MTAGDDDAKLRLRQQPPTKRRFGTTKSMFFLNTRVWAAVRGTKQKYFGANDVIFHSVCCQTRSEGCQTKAESSESGAGMQMRMVVNLQSSSQNTSTYTINAPNSQRQINPSGLRSLGSVTCGLWRAQKWTQIFNSRKISRNRFVNACMYLSRIK